LTASVAGAEFSLPALEFDLASRIGDYIASVAGTRRPRREVLKGLLSTNDLSLVRPRLTFIWGRARTTRQSGPGWASCNALFGPGTADELPRRQIHSPTDVR
jgi:hypothetical protein